MSESFWFESSKAKISLCKTSVHFDNVQVPTIQCDRIEPQSLAAPAIAYEQLLLSIQQYFFNERIVRVLQRELDFAQWQFRSHQIYFIYDFA
jgi:hypothetical protein